MVKTIESMNQAQPRLQTQISNKLGASTRLRKKDILGRVQGLVTGEKLNQTQLRVLMGFLAAKRVETG